MAAKQPELIGYKSICALADTPLNTVYMWAKRGILPKPKMHVNGRQPMFDMQEIEAWLRETGRHREQKQQIKEVI
ncbi:helix-turn-helix DNA binding domain protein [Gordonia phage Soos]|nr:helix-turn-helix DNA binding domain protein [Gordonia phage Soos]